jgi:HD-GYP domain-containing protein (c-di-GMP phosphodiesterase class II)
MRIAEDIYNEYGAIIIPDGTVLEDYVIEHIKKLGINKIRVYDNTGEMIEVSGADLFRAQYKENLNAVKSVLHDISAGRQIDSQSVDQTTRSILSRINENNEIVSCLNEMRSTGEYLYSHSVNVALLCMLIGKWLKFDYMKLKSLITAGFLHDIGKTRIAPEILNKPGPLSIEEFEEVKKHPVHGYKIAENAEGLNDDILKGILMHHEREDGSGYPFSLKGDKIHEFGKIVAVADVYDAMTSTRVYKEKQCPFDVIEVISVDHFNTLDNRITSVFLKNIASYYLGEPIRLNNGMTGEIVHINPFNISRPIIKSGNTYIDLVTKKDWKITELL